MENNETTNIQKIQKTAKKNDYIKFAVPRFSASLLRDSINKGFFKINPETQTSPVHTVYNAHTGFPLDAKDIIPASIMLDIRNARIENKNDWEKPIIFSKSFADKSHTQIKAGEKGLLYNFVNKNNELQTAQYYFAQQTKDPEKIIETANQKIEQNKAEVHFPENKNELVINNKEDYMSTLLLASKFSNDVKIVCSPEIEKEALKEISLVCENQLRSPALRDKTITPLNEFLYVQDLKAQDAFKEMKNENIISFPNKVQSQTQSHKIEQGIDR